MLVVASRRYIGIVIARGAVMLRGSTFSLFLLYPGKVRFWMDETYLCLSFSLEGSRSGRIYQLSVFCIPGKGMPSGRYVIRNPVRVRLAEEAATSLAHEGLHSVRCLAEHGTHSPENVPVRVATAEHVSGHVVPFHKG